MKEHLKKIKEKIDRFGIIKFLIILIIIFAVFQAGIFVGYHKARFYGSIEGNYYNSFNENRGRGEMMGGQYGFGNMMQDINLPSGHGAVGKIVSINLPNIVVASTDNVEKTINISNDTLIREFRNTLSTQDLKIGDYVIVLGEASSTDNGVVNARLIRLIPPPSISGTSTSTGTENTVNSATTSISTQ